MNECYSGTNEWHKGMNQWHKGMNQWHFFPNSPSIGKRGGGGYGSRFKGNTFKTIISHLMRYKTAISRFRNKNRNIIYQFTLCLVSYNSNLQFKTRRHYFSEYVLSYTTLCFITIYIYIYIMYTIFTPKELLYLMSSPLVGNGGDRSWTSERRSISKTLAKSERTRLNDG